MRAIAQHDPQTCPTCNRWFSRIYRRLGWAGNMILSQPNPYEQAVRQACDHANAGPDLEGLTFMQARIAIETWNHPGVNEGDPFRSNVCPDCGEPLILALKG